MAVHRRRKGIVKVEKLVPKGKIEYIGAKKKKSIKYARVECFKRIKVKDSDDILSLEKTVNMVVTKFNLKKLKFDLIRVNVMLEWDQFGKITNN